MFSVNESAWLGQKSRHPWSEESRSRFIGGECWNRRVKGLFNVMCLDCVSHAYDQSLQWCKGIVFWYTLNP